MATDPRSAIHQRALAEAWAQMEARTRMQVAHDKRVKAENVDQDFARQQADFRRVSMIEEQVRWARKDGMSDARAEQYREDMLIRKVDPWASRPRS